MNFAAILVSAGLLLLPGSARAYTCAQIVWALQHYTPAELEELAAPYGGISNADRAKARTCLREAGSRRAHLGIKAQSPTLAP